MDLKEYTGNATVLREITETDAADVIELRNNPLINQYLSSGAKISVADQENWIRNNSKLNDGVYFKILDKRSGRFCGTISLYNVENGRTEFGRYICISPLQSIESELLIIKYTFEVLKLNAVYCRTKVENVQVWKQHNTMGFIDKGEEVHPNYTLKIQEITNEGYRSFDYSKITGLISKLANR